MSTLTKLPLFPLSLVAFPEEKLNLHIFEPRYRQLVHDCVSTDTTFGIPPVEKEKPIKIGTEMRITEISRTYADGKMDIKTVGISKFLIVEFQNRMDEKLYPGGQIRRIDDQSYSDVVLTARVINLIEELYQLMKMKLSIPMIDDSFRIHHIAHKIGLNYNQEIELLNIHDETERLEYAVQHLTQFIPVVKEMEELRKKIQMNGHFKNVISPDINLDDL